MQFLEWIGRIVNMDENKWFSSCEMNAKGLVQDCSISIGNTLELPVSF